MDDPVTIEFPGGEELDIHVDNRILRNKDGTRGCPFLVVRKNGTGARGQHVVMEGPVELVVDPDGRAWMITSGKVTIVRGSPSPRAPHPVTRRP